MISAISNALTGLTGAAQKVNQASTNIANATTPGYTTETGDTVELSEEAVNLIAAETQFKANAAVLRTAADLTDEFLASFNNKD